jgi:hypothetical protein
VWVFFLQNKYFVNMYVKTSCLSGRYVDKQTWMFYILAICIKCLNICYKP